MKQIGLVPSEKFILDGQLFHRIWQILQGELAPKTIKIQRFKPHNSFKMI